MASMRNIIIYSTLAICLFCTSIYSMYIFGMTHSVFFTDTELLFPFMQKISLPYTIWNLPTHLMFFPDAFVYYILSFLTSNTKECLVFYTITMSITLFLVLMFILRKKREDNSVGLYIAIWSMILILYCSNIPLLAQIFLPNGFVGFMILYSLALHFLYSILYEKPSPFTKAFLCLILVLCAFSSPIISFILLGMPALLLSLFHRRIDYHSDKIFLVDILIAISISCGVILQLYLLPERTHLSLLPLDEENFIVSHPLLTLISILGGCYTCIIALSSKQDKSIYISRIASLGLILGVLATIIGILEFPMFLLFLFTFTLMYAIPHSIISFISLLTIRYHVALQLLLVLASGILGVILYCNYTFTSNRLPSADIIVYLESTAPKEQPVYVLAPRSIAGEITLFNTRNIFAIPYIPHTLEYASFIPDEALHPRYSAFIIEKRFQDTALLQQLYSLIGIPTKITAIDSYIVMEYQDGFMMPHAGKLATYTTPLGNHIREHIETAPRIPLPSLPSTLPIKEIHLLQDRGNTFITLTFDKDTTFPLHTEYVAYTLSPSSNALRKLASGIRRELPFLAPLLPLEDKNKIVIDGLKDVYTLPNHDNVIAIDVSPHVQHSLTFLSLAIKGEKPTIIFQYPTPPIKIPAVSY